MALRYHELGGGVRLPYLEVGDAGGPPLVLLRGLGDALATVESAKVAAGVERGCAAFGRRRVIVPSWRVPAVPGDGLDVLAADVARLLTELDLGPAPVWGNSMGGMVGLALAREHRGLVSRLVCESTPSHVGPPLARLLDRWTAMARRGAWAALQRDTLRRIYTGRMPWRIRLLLPLTRLIPVPDDPERFGVLAAALRPFDARSWPSLPGCPALVIGGREDVMTPPADLADLAGRLPAGRLELLDGAGHGACEERPEAFARAVGAFLDAGPPPRSRRRRAVRPGDTRRPVLGYE